jgi:integrase
LVLKVLEPIWKDKTETGKRVRGRIESVLDWATVRGYRSGENPARWRGHLKHLLPSPEKIRKVEHLPALPYPELPAFMAELRKQDGVAALLLEFTTLTAVRPSEAREARWGEFNLLDKIWTVPPERMKGRREHRVPLSDRALIILERMAAHRQGDDSFVFPGDKARKPLSDGAVSRLLNRMGHTDITPHGFRSTFRDWAEDRTNYSPNVIEKALAHAIADKVEAAYRRGDLFEKRRRLMSEWARYASGSHADSRGAQVTPIRVAAAQ